MIKNLVISLIRVLLIGMFLGTSVAQAKPPAMLLAMGGGGMMHGMMHGAGGHDAQKRPPDTPRETADTHQHAGTSEQQNTSGQAQTDNHAHNPSTSPTDRVQNRGASIEHSTSGSH